MDLIILFFAIKLVKNLCQDLVWLARGEDPPSFRREQERRRLRAARSPIAGRGEARKFWANAWDDAWQSANERRERSRQEKHARADTERKGAEPAKPDVAPMDVAEPLEPTAADTPKPVVHDDYSLIVGGKEETLYQRYAMRRRNDGQPMTAAAVADELGTTVTEAEKIQTAWAGRYDQETNPDQPPQHLLEYQKRSRCLDCDGTIALKKNPERPGNWIVGVKHTRDDCPQNVQRDQQVQEARNAALHGIETDPRKENEEDAADRATREQSLDAMYPDRRIKRSFDLDDPANWTPAFQLKTTPDSPNNKESTSMTATGETTGLQAALSYTEQMAQSSGEGATSVETSLASLQAGEVGGAGLAHLAQAQELLTQAQAAFDAANAEFTNHMNVKEAYDANPDAGNKQFLTNN